MPLLLLILTSLLFSASACTEAAEQPNPDRADPETARPTGDNESKATAIDPARLRATVSYLASQEMRGRDVGSDENRRASQWIADRFAEIGLEPGVHGEWFHDFRYRKTMGRNVAGILRAGRQSDEYVIVAAHHDHRGFRKITDNMGVERILVFPGADDNASGVAAVLAIAEELIKLRDQLEVNVVFISYDAEEKGMVGSSNFVFEGIIPTSKTRFMMVFDLIGGHFLPWDKKRVYLIGTEHSAFVRQVVKERMAGREIEPTLIGTYVIEIMGAARSDYMAYRKSKVPYLFMSTATPWYYHTPDDKPERLDYPFMAKNVLLAFDILQGIVFSQQAPDFIRKPPGEIADAELLRSTVQEVLDHADELGMGKAGREILRKDRILLDKVIAKGKLGSRERRNLWKIFMDIFRQVRRFKPK